MKTLPGWIRSLRNRSMLRTDAVLALAFWIGATSIKVQAVTTYFFEAAQGTNLISSGTTSDTLGSMGYVFTLSRDKLFTGGVGLTNPIGRFLRVQWPDGLEAQAVTTGPVVGGARIDLRRADGLPFAIESFTAQLLANTAGAGGAIEIMPKIQGEDGVPNPFAYDVSGYYGNRFHFITPELSGFDSYSFTLYVDFALIDLTVVDASLPTPTLEVVPVDATTIKLLWPDTATGYHLESESSLSPAVWVPSSATVQTEGGSSFVLVSPDTGQKWYRLSQ